MKHNGSDFLEPIKEGKRLGHEEASRARYCLGDGVRTSRGEDTSKRWSRPRGQEKTSKGGESVQGSTDHKDIRVLRET